MLEMTYDRFLENIVANMFEVQLAINGSITIATSSGIYSYRYGCKFQVVLTSKLYVGMVSKIVANNKAIICIL